MLNPKNYLPNLELDYRTNELIDTVSIYRDEWGIPHIDAKNQNDLFFAQGFVTAQDRLFQMDLDRLRCLGRSSEYLGERALTNDELNLKRDFISVAKGDLEKASTDSKNMLKNFTKGINYYITNLNTLPIEYHLLKKEPEEWNDLHSILVYKIRNSAEGTFNTKLFYSKLAKSIGGIKAAKLTTGYLPGALLTIPPGKTYSGLIENAINELTEAAKNYSTIGDIDGESNGWAISGKKTYSGFPLVAGDSHRALDTPNVYYQIHLKCEDFESIGFTIPGYPGILHFAHNQKVAWGMTHGGGDTQDLFLEKLRIKDKKIQFYNDGKWINANHFTSKISPRNGQVKKVRIIKTKNGNIIFGSPEKKYGISLSDPGGSDKGTYWINSAFNAMKSESADDLESAFNAWTDRTNNYPYADIKKNFGYKFAGSVPVRNSQHQWGIVKGWEKKYFVKGEIPRDKLPSIRNPKNKWVVTCNQRVVDHDYPFFISNTFAPEFRAKVLINYINKYPKKLNINNMLEMHNEKYSIPAEKIISYGKSINIKNCDLSNLELKALDELFNWNFIMDINSPAASIYSVCKEEIVRYLVKINYGDLANNIINNNDPSGVFHVRRFLIPLINEQIGLQKSFLLQNKIKWDKVFISSFKYAVKFLNDRFDNNIDNWKWGFLHRTNHKHPLSEQFKKYSEILDPPKTSAGGDGDTPFAGSYNKNFQIIAASVNRYAHDPYNWENSRWIVPLGSSGNPGSKNYHNQLELWAKGKTIPQLWNWDIIRNKCSIQKLIPIK